MVEPQNLVAQDIITLTKLILIPVGLTAFGYLVTGVVAVWRARENGASEFFRMIERMNVLQILTVIIVIAAATLLALLGRLDSNGVTGILSGVAGYVLGGLGGRSKATVPSRNGKGNTEVASAESTPRSD